VEGGGAESKAGEGTQRALGRGTGAGGGGGEQVFSLADMSVHSLRSIEGFSMFGDDSHQAAARGKAAAAALEVEAEDGAGGGPRARTAADNMKLEPLEQPAATGRRDSGRAGAAAGLGGGAGGGSRSPDGPDAVTALSEGGAYGGGRGGDDVWEGGAGGDTDTAGLSQKPKDKDKDNTDTDKPATSDINSS
jgi:hypothetical protein